MKRTSAISRKGSKCKSHPHLRPLLVLLFSGSAFLLSGTADHHHHHYHHHGWPGLPSPAMRHLAEFRLRSSTLSHAEKGINQAHANQPSLPPVCRFYFIFFHRFPVIAFQLCCTREMGKHQTASNSVSRPVWRVEAHPQVLPITTQPP